MPRRQTHQGLKFPTENILTHTDILCALSLGGLFAILIRYKEALMNLVPRFGASFLLALR